MKVKIGALNGEHTFGKPGVAIMKKKPEVKTTTITLGRQRSFYDS
jgi:hypothetical protein